MRPRTVLAVVLGGLALLFLPAGPAAAHTGKITLTVATDGAEGITVQATYADGHPLDQPVRLVLTATGEAGQRVGPLQLGPNGEGQGFYSTGPVLTSGRWKVTVTAPAPHGATTTSQVVARAAQPPPPPPTARARAGAPDVTVERTPAAGSSGPGRWWPVAAGVVALLAVAGAVPLLLTARRRRR